jgi:hypothetical protein
MNPEKPLSPLGVRYGKHCRTFSLRRNADSSGRTCGKLVELKTAFKIPRSKDRLAGLTGSQNRASSG